MNRQPNNKNSFAELEQMLVQVEAGGLRSLNSDDVMRFGHFYRQVVSALSSARSQGVNDSHIEYLNQLAARAYGHIYTAESKGWPSIANFFKNDFPQSFRRNLLFIAIAFAISVGAAFFAASVVHRDEGKAAMILGPSAEQMIQAQAERHTGKQDWMPEEERPIMSSFVMTNNIRVAATAFATGILGCVLTFFILFQNGLMLGVIGAAMSARGTDVALSFWSFVAPHGVIELTAIFIAGGAGLMLGWSLLSPGEHTRRVALKLAAREASKLILGVAAMLVVAGLIEGFFSPSMVHAEVKLTVAMIIFMLQFYYLFFAGTRDTGLKRSGY